MRSATPTRPRPLPGTGGTTGPVRSSSVTSTMISSGRWSSFTSTRSAFGAYRSTLVSDSCTTRKTASCRPGSSGGVPVLVKRTGRPVERNESTSAARSACPGWGARSDGGTASPAPGSSARTPSMRRISDREVRPVSATSRIASRASSGRATALAAAPSASVTMTVIPWATMSWISRAIRVRSAAVASRACWSRSRASCTARSRSAST